MSVVRSDGRKRLHLRVEFDYCNIHLMDGAALLKVIQQRL